jgi:hypothetical protein
MSTTKGANTVSRGSKTGKYVAPNRKKSDARSTTSKNESGSLADKKMMSAWRTISEISGSAAKKK